MASVAEMAQAARAASQQLAVASGLSRNAALEAIASALEAQRDRVLEANGLDVEEARQMVERGELDQPLLKRLDLSGSKYDATVAMVRSKIGRAHV